MVDLCEVKVGSPIWGSIGQDGTLELRLDSGDSGYLKFTPREARAVVDTLKWLLKQREKPEDNAGLEIASLEAMAACDTSAALRQDAPIITLGMVGKLARAHKELLSNIPAWYSPDDYASESLPYNDVQMIAEGLQIPSIAAWISLAREVQRVRDAERKNGQ